MLDQPINVLQGEPVDFFFFFFFLAKISNKVFFVSAFQHNYINKQVF